MNCFKCATPIPDSSRFCMACGADVSGEGHNHEKTIEVGADPELMSKLQMELGGEYIVERELGRGGMAAVYLGHDAHLGRKVAIKVLPPELTFGNSGMIERFKREARTAATLDHNNIIPVYRVSTGGKLFWYVMKYLQGEALDRIIQREGQLPIDRTVHIVSQVADGLGYAHKHQVVHRDVKPANVMIDPEGRVTVTDFGIAKALDSSALTGSGAMIGTPYFMSPEQCSGKQVTGASDQYSLAVMVYQMLSGHVPFDGESAVDIIRAHVMDPVPPLEQLRPGLPASMVRVIYRALSKSPAERYPDVVSFAQSLAATAKGLAATASPPAHQKPPRMSKTALVSPIPGAMRTAKGRLGPNAVIAAGLVIGVALAAAGFIATKVMDRGGALPEQAGPPSGTQLAVVPTPPPAPASAPDTVQRLPDTAKALAAPPAASPARPPARQPARQPARTPVSAPVSPPAAAPSPAPAPAAAPPPAPSGPAFITVASRPISAMTINGRAAPGNPLSNFEVPAGTVRIVFTVTDSTGSWSVERTFQLAPGESRNLGRIQLTRP